MNHRDDLDRTLETWFGADAPPTAPRHVLESVVAETGRHAPRPAWLASLRGDGMGTPALLLGRPARPLVLLAILGALLAGLIGGAVLTGAGPRFGLSIGPRSTVQPTPYVAPEPTLFVSGGAMPLVDVPDGLNPGTTAGSWERHVAVLLQEYVRQVGWEVGQPRITAIRLLRPGATYQTTWVDGLDHGGTGFTAERLSWAIDAQGTLLTCGRRCAVFGSGTLFFDDASEALLAIGASGPTTAIPSAPYREIVDSVGRAFRPKAEVPTGYVDQATILASMTAAGRLPAGANVDPIYGTVICVGSTPPCQGWGFVEAGQSEDIWWVGLPDVMLPPDALIGGPGPAWYTFDAQTGEDLLRTQP